MLAKGIRSRFIHEAITVHFAGAPLLEKKPGCPQSFTWRGTRFIVVEVISEWHDYRRRGDMARNMRPTHLAAAMRKGSWGVGRDYFRVRSQDGRIFDVYYDRAPKGSDARKGSWWLDRELLNIPEDTASA